MATPSFRNILTNLGVDYDPAFPKKVLVARHASEAYAFLHADIGDFEEYQRFQTRNYFGSCRRIISFVGLPNKGNMAAFVGIYQVFGRFTRGGAGFRDPIGSAELLACLRQQDHMYDLVRMSEYDMLIGQWEIEWKLPGSAKYVYLKPDFDLPVSRYDAWQNQASHVSLDEDSVSFAEGTLKYVTHARRERSGALVRGMKIAAKKANTFRCFACNLNFEEKYGMDYLECHHTVPVSTLGPEDRTRPEDMVLLCANCHRAAHRTKPWLRKSDLHNRWL